MLQQGESVNYKYIIDNEWTQEVGKAFNFFPLLHHDDEYAKKVGFEKRLIPGVLVSSIIIKSLVLAFGNSTILREHNLEFKKPIFPESEVGVELYVLKNIRNKVVSLRSRVYVGRAIHCEGFSKIRVFENI
jgi:acyl dehydratase